MVAVAAVAVVWCGWDSAPGLIALTASAKSLKLLIFSRLDTLSGMLLRTVGPSPEGWAELLTEFMEERACKYWRHQPCVSRIALQNGLKIT